MSNQDNHSKSDQSPSHIVGIGASAGGLEAIEQFIKNMTSPSDLAFVIVHHLSPDYKSLMVELLSKYTVMPVSRIEDGMIIEKNHVYLIPPRKNLKIFHGRLLLVDQERSEGQINLPIDIFFRSLAEDQGENAIGIVLSGTGSDGTRGVRAIKEKGGMVMAQTEDSAKFDSMPKNAIATGLVDFILPPDVMPQQLLTYVKHPFSKLLAEKTKIPASDNGLARIFSLLRESYKVDFTYYKPSTIIRRIERRITINQCEGLNDYISLLESRPSEIKSLFQELLIRATSFFRDEAVFEQIKGKILPEVFSMAQNNELRIWVAGCSTGEEAYSVAMLCAEYKDLIKSPLKIKIFATDVDEVAIEKAGMGVYPDSVSADIPAEYLSRFFVRLDECYRVSREIREMVVFAQHDLIKDPPFTNINLVTCRNLLIYLQPILQRKVLELFNFSLNPKGILVLGNSESIGEMDECFTAVESKLKIFQSRGKQRLLRFASVVPSKDWSPSTVRIHQENESLLRLTEERFFNRFIQVMSEHAILPLTIIVDDRMEVTHVFGDSKEYLQYSSGKVNLEIAKVVVKELSIPVSTGLQKALKTQQPISLSNIRLQHKQDQKLVNVQIFPMIGKGVQESLFAVLISEPQVPKTDAAIEGGISYNVGLEAEQRISDLEQELQFSRENLQATVEELETSNEELQATNEELLASNEELQSTNEELQSVNEELYTVNAEFQSKIAELTILNTDMDNLFNSTQIAALFLDENLEIRRFTPKFKDLFPVMDTDIGRPINHLSMQLDEKIHLQEIIDQVVSRGKPIEREFQVAGLGWNLLRATPYQISNSVNAGVVLTIIDIDQLKRAQQELLSKTEKKIQVLAKVVKNARDAIIQFKADGTILSWNRGAERMYGWESNEALNMTMRDIIPEQSEINFTNMMEQLSSANASVEMFNLQRVTKSGEIIDVSSNFTILTDQSQDMIIASMEHDIEQEKKILHDECIDCVNSAFDKLEQNREAMILLDQKSRIKAWNATAERVLGWNREETLDRPLDEFLPGLYADQDKKMSLPKFGTGLKKCKTKSGMEKDILVSIAPIGYPKGLFNLVLIQSQ